MRPSTEPTPARGGHDPYRALRIPAFRWYMVSTAAVTIGVQVQVIVVSWQIYARTRDPLSLGLIGLAEALPFIAVALWAGHVADRFDRQKVALAALTALVGCAAALMAFQIWPTAIGNALWPYYAVIAISGVARSFLQPARTALAAMITPPEVYHNAIAWRSSTWQASAVAGPAVGGAIYGFVSPTAAYATQAVLMVVALASLARIRYVREVATVDPGSESALSGLRFVFRQPILLGALALDLFSVLLAGAEALLPIFADQILHVGPQGLGVLRAAPAFGAVLTSVYLAHRPPFRRAGRALLLAVAAFALCIIGFGLSRSFNLSLILLIASGIADNVSVVIRSTLLQTLTPPGLLGRVSSVNAIFVGSSNEIGAFESGVVARLIGPVPAVVTGGIAALLVVGVVSVAIPRLRQLRAISADGSG